jgi:4-hydroxy-3-polyprenylbenzoate decarboxylase
VKTTSLPGSHRVASAHTTSEKFVGSISSPTRMILGMYQPGLEPKTMWPSRRQNSMGLNETIRYETPYTPKDIRDLASHTYSVQDAAAKISGGSFQTDGMIIVPCSMRTLSAVRTGFADDLICRAADVTLKEKRKLMIVVRETPLSCIHLENMLALVRSDVVIFPPMPAFYTKPENIEDIVAHSVGRVMDTFGLEAEDIARWDGSL